MNSRVRYFFRSLLPVAAFLFVQNAALIFSSQVLVVIQASRFSGGSYSDFLRGLIKGVSSPDFLQAAALASSAMGVMLFLTWYIRLKAALPGSKPEPTSSDQNYRLGIYIALFAMGAQYVSNYLIVFLDLAFPEWAEQYERIQEMMGIGEGLTPVFIVNSILLGPACEELCLRGLTYTYASLAMPARTANIVQALLFGGLHGNPIQSIYAFFLGLVLGEIYARSGRISLCIALHCIFNAFGILLNRYIYIGNTPVNFFIILFTALMCSYYSFCRILEEIEVRNCE